MGMLMQKIQAGSASAEEQREFGRLWQERVKRLLIGHGEAPELVSLNAGP